MIAGKTTKSNKLGVVASFPIPEVIRNINAFTLGAKSTNPKATVRAVWISSWFDPAKEKEAALTMINQGVDVLIQNTDSSATLQTAQEKGVFAFGWDSDMSKFADKAHLASAVVYWAPYYKSRVKAVLDGSWKTAHTWWGMAQDTNELASINASVPEELKKLVMDKKAAIKAGTFHPFSGPIKNQKGEEVVKAGVTMSDDDMRKLDYYVQGVEGGLPAKK
jgi:simple sugar transport system substrate-binding protein